LTRIARAATILTAFYCRKKTRLIRLTGLGVAARGNHLVNGFGKPNAAAWETEELFTDCRDSLVRYLRYHLDDLSDAEDIAQESFIRFFHARTRN